MPDFFHSWNPYFIYNKIMNFVEPCLAPIEINK